MPRTVTTITISLPPELADEVARLSRLECRNKSEFVREALKRYIGDRQNRGASLQSPPLARK